MSVPALTSTAWALVEGSGVDGRVFLDPDSLSDLYFWLKVRDHDISCQWRTARTPSRGLSQASCRAGIILIWKAYDKVPRVRLQEGTRHWRVGTQ